MNSKPCFYVCSSFPVRATTVLYQLMTLMNNNRQETLKCVSLSRGWAEVVLSPMIPEGKTGGRKNTGTTNDLSLYHCLLKANGWLHIRSASSMQPSFRFGAQETLRWAATYTHARFCAYSGSSLARQERVNNQSLCCRSMFDRL